MLFTFINQKIKVTNSKLYILVIIKYRDYYPYIKKKVKKPVNIKYLKYWEEIQQNSSISFSYYNLGTQLSSNESIILPNNSK